jgi:hypothetical protein
MIALCALKLYGHLVTRLETENWRKFEKQKDFIL